MKRFLSLLMAVVMVMTLLPVVSFATEFDTENFKGLVLTTTADDVTVQLYNGYSTDSSKLMSELIVYALMFSSAVTAIPNYLIMTYLGLVDTPWAVILTAIGGTLGLYLMKNFIGQIPDSLIEAGWNISEEHIREGLRDTRWPGRFDIMGRQPLFIIDGGHNPQCIEALVKNIEDYLVGKRLIVLTGVLALISLIIPMIKIKAIKPVKIIKAKE